jgi:hypothetical protein
MRAVNDLERRREVREISVLRKGSNTGTLNSQSSHSKKLPELSTLMTSSTEMIVTRDIRQNSIT